MQESGDKHRAVRWGTADDKARAIARTEGSADESERSARERSVEEGVVMALFKI